MKHHPDCHPSSACYNDHGAYSDMCQDFDEAYERGKAEGRREREIEVTDILGHLVRAYKGATVNSTTLLDECLTRIEHGEPDPGIADRDMALADAIEAGEHVKADEVK